MCVLGAVAYLQVSPLGGSRDETWRGQGIRKRPVLEFAKTTSIVTMQRRCRAMYHTEPPKDKTIREWYMKFQQSGCLCAAKRTGRPRPSAETVESVRETLVRSLQKSTYRASQELQMPQSSVWRILRKRLRVKGYRLQLLQALNPHDHNLRLHFCVDFQLRLEEEGYAEKLVSSDEATFHVCAEVTIGKFQDTEFLLIPCPRRVSPRLLLAVKRRLVLKKKLGENFYLLICSFLLCLSWLLGSRVRKSRRDLWITLYLACFVHTPYSYCCFRNSLPAVICTWLLHES